MTPLTAGNPRAAQQAVLMNQPPLNYRLILKRQRLVQRMFDTAISFRLAQLKDARERCTARRLALSVRCPKYARC